MSLVLRKKGLISPLGHHCIKYKSHFKLKSCNFVILFCIYCILYWSQASQNSGLSLTSILCNVFLLLHPPPAEFQSINLFSSVTTSFQTVALSCSRENRSCVVSMWGRLSDGFIVILSFNWKNMLQLKG